MDDKFDQWCLTNTGRPSSAYAGLDLLIFKSAYNVERLDAEILELKRRIEILEGKL